MMIKSHDRLADELRARLADLIQREHALTDALRAEHARDAVEQATERENDQVIEGLDLMTRGEILQIRGALARIEQGRYGRCVRCDGPIGQARLDAAPTIATCLTCTPLQGHDTPLVR